MAFIISGDIHGTLDIGKLVKFFDEHEGEYNSDDYLIICGDVGITKAEMWSKFFSKGKPYRRYAYAYHKNIGKYRRTGLLMQRSVQLHEKDIIGSVGV